MIMAIIGIAGRMGNAIYEYYKTKFEIVGIDKLKVENVRVSSSLDDLPTPDIIIDFSDTSSYDILLDAIKRGIIVVSGTTGYTNEEINELKKLGGDKFIWSCNFASGITMLEDILDIISKEYPVFDFIELHSITKKDSPSGTAKYLADRLKLPYERIHSIRLPFAPAMHEVIFTSPTVRLIVRHEIIDKRAFVEGLDKIVRCITNYDTKAL